MEKENRKNHQYENREHKNLIKDWLSNSKIKIENIRSDVSIRNKKKVTKIINEQSGVEMEESEITLLIYKD